MSLTALLGIDVGKARIGVAACDPGRMLAFPVETVERDDAERWVGRIAELAEQYRAGGLICGLPVNLHGEDTDSTRDARMACGRLVEATGLEAWLVDERMTTNVAARQLQPSKRKRGRQRSVIDQAAAVVILQQALDVDARTGSLPGTRVTKGESA